MQKITLFHEQLSHKCLVSQTRLLVILLLIGSYSFAQTWNQVGNAQFSTNFSELAEFTFDNNGDPYVVYEHPSGNAIYVMKYDGTNWVDVGSSPISTENYNNLDITINPVTNQPWVALKAQANGSGSNIDVYSFDGSSWVVEGSNIGGSFWTYGIYLNFSSSGVAQVVGVISSGGNDRRAIAYTKNSSGNWGAVAGGLDGSLGRIDAYAYDQYTMVDFGGNIRVSDFSNTISTVNILSSSSHDFVDVSSYNIDDTFYAASYSDNNNRIVTAVNDGSASVSMAQPSNATALSQTFVKMRQSPNDSRHYLMYSDASDQLAFDVYNEAGDFWSPVTKPNIPTNTTSFFARMDINPVDGDMYILWQDGARLSMKKFEVESPLGRYYVDANVSGGDGSGDSWANAIPDLQTALGVAGTNTSEIWVAAGIYKPGNLNTVSFEISIDDLHLYGGFDGTESSITERDVFNNPTILSGDINGNDNGVSFYESTRSDNSIHVVRLNANNVVLDGLQINDGSAVGSSGSTDERAGGIYVNELAQNLVIRNCQFYNNLGEIGGAIYSNLNVNTSMNIENCIFSNNVSRYGTGICFLLNDNITATFEMTNTLFYNNISEDAGSGAQGFTGSSLWVRANSSGSNLTTTISNCTFANNRDRGTTASSDKGTLALTERTDGNSTHNATINNSIFYNNKQGTSNAMGISINKGHAHLPSSTFVYNSISDDSFSNLTYLTNTSNSNPLFTDMANNDFTLQTSSPAVDTGDNTKVPAGITTDLLGNQRIFNITVDMGAYEFDPSLGVNDLIISEYGIKLYPNPTSSILNIEMTQNLKHVSIYSILGAEVLSTQHKTIDVSGLSNGVFLIKIEDENGNVSTKRFVKK